MKHLLPIVLLFFAANSNAQQLKYFGFDSVYAYFPTDVIETNNGGLFIVNTVNYSGPVHHNYHHWHYLLQLDKYSDTLWSKFYHNSYTANVVATQNADSTFTLVGGTQGSYVCGGWGTTNPMSDYFIRRMSKNGDSTFYASYHEHCSNVLQNYHKEGDTTFLLYSFYTGTTTFYQVRRLLKNGNTATKITDVTASGVSYYADFLKHKNGFIFLMGNKVSKMSFDGSLLWEDTIQPLPAQVKDFCNTNSDSLVIACSSNSSYLDSTIIVKTDTLINQTWKLSLKMRAQSIFKHSSGNYIVSGNFGDSVVVAAISPDGTLLWTQSAEAYAKVFVTKSIELSDGSIATVGHIGMFGEFGQMFLFKSGNISSITENTTYNNGSLLLFPNPNNGKFTLQIQDNQPYKIRILNTLGQIEWDSIEETEIESFDLTLTKGIHFIKATNRDGLEYQKKFLVY